MLNNLKSDLNKLKNPERIFIIGPGGVGKTKYARKIVAEKGLKYIELDRLRWPEQQKLSDDLFQKKLKKIVQQDTWVIEGTLKGVQDIIFPRCTQIIILTAPRIVCTWRALMRTIKRLLLIEKKWIFNDTDKLFSKDFIVFYVWRHYPRYMRQIQEALSNTKYSAEVKIVHI